MAVTDAQIRAYSSPLEGYGLPAASLQGLIASQNIVLLHFLRHLGCLYCTHSVQELYRFAQGQVRFPPLYFVHQSPVAEATLFFDTYFPGARHISDPALSLYRLFEIRRLNPVQFLNPLQIAKGAAAMLRGHRQNEVKGDQWVLSGTFLFYEGQLRWQHRATYAGDDPDWARFAAQ